MWNFHTAFNFSCRKLPLYKYVQLSILHVVVLACARQLYQLIACHTLVIYYTKHANISQVSKFTKIVLPTVKPAPK